MAEFYKEVARYRADIDHQASGQMIDYTASVYEGPSPGRFYIRHSHTFKPTQSAGGFWYSNSHTQADSAEDAEDLVRSWVDQIEKSYEVAPWD